jgi:hypothetical protein
LRNYSLRSYPQITFDAVITKRKGYLFQNTFAFKTYLLSLLSKPK